jgi:very-short-patch-repair endonuclease
MDDVVGILQRSGGGAAFAELRTVVSGKAIRRALTLGQISRVSKGVYALPDGPSDIAVAMANGGVLSHESAALHHGLDVVTKPLIPHVTIGRKSSKRETELDCTLHWADLPGLAGGGNLRSDPDRAVAEEPRPLVTDPLRTVLDCARRLPFGEALAVVDSAIRLGKVDRKVLAASAAALKGPGRRTAIRACCLAAGRAASALESMLRSRVIEAGITGFVPQYVVRGLDFFARVDLADPRLRIAIEADSFAHHGTRDSLRKDCRRYTCLAASGWRLLRYSWEDVMLDDRWVGDSLQRTISGSADRSAFVKSAA